MKCNNTRNQSNRRGGRELRNARLAFFPQRWERVSQESWPVTPLHPPQALEEAVADCRLNYSPVRWLSGGLNVIFCSHIAHFNYARHRQTSCIFKWPVTSSPANNVNCKRMPAEGNYTCVQSQLWSLSQRHLCHEQGSVQEKIKLNDNMLAVQLPMPPLTAPPLCCCLFVQAEGH